MQMIREIDGTKGYAAGFEGLMTDWRLPIFRKLKMTGQPPISILNTIRHSADHTVNSDLTFMPYRWRCIS